LHLAVDVRRGTELPGERFLIHAAGDRDGFESHLRGELNSQVAEATNAQYGHEIAGARAAVAQRIESGDAGAHQGPASVAESPSGIAAKAPVGAIMYSA
jgi:hypothetical protein